MTPEWAALVVSLELRWIGVRVRGVAVCSVRTAQHEALHGMLEASTNRRSLLCAQACTLSAVSQVSFAPAFCVERVLGCDGCKDVDVWPNDADAQRLMCMRRRKC